MVTKKRLKGLKRDMLICRAGITDAKVRIGFNMAIALCNKWLGKDYTED